MRITKCLRDRPPWGREARERRRKSTRNFLLFSWLAQVVQKVNSAIHRINHYPAEKYYGNQLRQPMYGDLSGGQRYPTYEQLGPEL